ncbi:hypothetical protein F2Q68_00042050 [Brassica cretica]|uniref:PLAT domain-containing protein n=1 Tax=Brassica cretica TaxID=69181 RepID=A0A8S9MNN1_BRACR|nr:hypothetical protein F2Q68_00042050 [Brassica cretica]
MARHDIHLLFVLIATISVVALASENCHYTIPVKTGSRHDSGTDAVIGIVLADKSGKYIEIKNLVSWGGNMEPGRDYFENYYLDIFTGTEQCLPTTICFMTLNSDGSGHKPGWYAANVDVKTTKTGTPSKYQHFTVEQWLANSEPPYLLYAERDNCPSGIKKSPYSIIYDKTTYNGLRFKQTPELYSIISKLAPPTQHGDGNSLPSNVPAALLGWGRGGDGLGRFRNVSETAGTAKVLGDVYYKRTHAVPVSINFKFSRFPSPPPYPYLSPYPYLCNIDVQTGTRADSGTDAVIGIVLADQSEEYIEIKDLANWGGKMPEGHDYFENGNPDIFSGTERCLPGPVCFMRLNSDNSGYKPGWYVVYVDVTTSKPGSVSKQQRFTMEQWLAVDEPPNQLYAERSNCPV